MMQQTVTLDLIRQPASGREMPVFPPSQQPQDGESVTRQTYPFKENLTQTEMQFLERDFEAFSEIQTLSSRGKCKARLCLAYLMILIFGMY